MLHKVILTSGFLLISSLIFGQQFGGNPATTNWKQINSDTARIIFEDGMDSLAIRISSNIHRIAEKNALPLGNQMRKVNIVLQNQNTKTNGYVGLAPFRSEFYTTPPSSPLGLGSIRWIDKLSLHEYRHVQQYNNFENGISKTIKTIFGEEGYAVAMNAAVPDWFFEGEAVHAETILSPQGRGRLPAFMSGFYALWEAGKKYSWMKLRNGSMKDFVPNHYSLGYQLVNYGYKKYGDAFWRNVTQDATAYKGLFYPFQKAIKRHSTISYKEFYNAALSTNESDFLAHSTKSHNGYYGLSLSEKSIPPKNYVTHYLYPQYISEDSLVYVKKSYRHRPSFVLKLKEGEKEIAIRDISNEDYFSYKNGKIVYTGYEKDPRWNGVDYSVIKTIDISTGKKETLTQKTKYFTPDLSPNSLQIVAIENNEKGESSIHFLKASDGTVDKVYTNKNIIQFVTPRFINNNEIIVAAVYANGTMNFVRLTIDSGKLEALTPATYHAVAFPSVKGDSIYFNATYMGRDDLYVMSIIDHSIYPITQSGTGNYNVHAISNKLVWSNFTAEGYQLKEATIISGNKQTLKPFHIPATSELYSIAGTTDVNFITDSSTRNFTIEKYKKGTKLFNFHSWRPNYDDPIFSYSIYGENILNTFLSEVYYEYNENDRSNAVGFNARYGGWFPQLSAGWQYNFNRNSKVGNLTKEWSQLDTRVGINIPLQTVKGTSINSFNIGSNYNFRQQYHKGFYKDSLGNTSFSYLHHFISFARQTESAVQHIYPRWGVQSTLQYRHAISGHKSWQQNGEINFYLPGIAANHSMVIAGGYQQVDTLNTLFSDRFAYSRGFNNPYFATAWKISGNYHFPIWHADFGLANIFYLKRWRANAFYDFTKVYSADKSQSRNQRSAGLEWFFDTKWWNQHELSFGVRWSYLIDNDFYTPNKKSTFEFILPLSIIPR